MLKIGDRFGDYAVVKLLGKGGMGAVYLLENAEGVQVAAKILDPAEAGDHEARKRFLREAQLALGVKHPNLVETYDVGEDPETELCYILMEYAPNGSLADRIKAGPLAVTDAIGIVYQVASVLELARGKGIVHRDIKPGNILFGADGKAKLADLGIARGGLAGTETTTVTQTGMMIGTPAYMAPEQMLDAHSVDIRADIYSLGIVFYEMLVGKRPNADDTVVQLMAKAVAGEPIPDVRTMRPEVSAAVAELISLMCAMRADERVQTPAEVTTAISQIVHGREVTIRRKAPKRISPRGKSTGRARKVLTAGSVLLAVVGLVAAAYFGSRRPSRPGPAEGSAAKPAPAVKPLRTAEVPLSPTARPSTPFPRAVSDVVTVTGKRQLPRTFRWDARTELEFLSCPPGRFTHDQFDGRMREVTITRPYWLMKFPVTGAMWKSVFGTDAGSSFRAKRLDQFLQMNAALGGDDAPAYPGQPMDVEDFCDRLNARFARELPPGYVFRLPTIAEWMHAFVAGSNDPNDPYNRVFADRVERTDDLSALCTSPAERRKRLEEAGVSQKFDPKIKQFLLNQVPGVSVGRHRPNAWGFHDMFGNTCEMTFDLVGADAADWEQMRVHGQVPLAECRLAGGADVWTDPLFWAVATSPEAREKGSGGVFRSLMRCGNVAKGRYARCNPCATFGTYFNYGFRVCLGPDLQKERRLASPVPPAWERRNPASAADGRRGPTDRRIRFAKVGECNWFYSLENGEAVLWRGNNGYNNETKPCVEPAPEGEVEIPAELDGHKVTVIGNLAFFRCDRITRVTVPEGVRELRGWGCFYECRNLAEIVLPESLAAVTGPAFEGCGALRSIDLGKCTEIRGLAFPRCGRLESIRVAHGNSRYRSVDGALYSRDGRVLVAYPRTRDVLNLVPGVCEIGDGACLSCPIRKLNLPDGIRRIGVRAFAQNQVLSEVTLGEGLESVGSSAFAFCRDLREVTFPASLKRVGNSLFERDGRLRRVVFGGGAPEQDSSRESVLGRETSDFEIVVRPGTVGWNGPGSTDLPEKWPLGNFDDSRRIRYAGESDVVPTTAAGSVVVEAPAELAKEKAKLEEMLAKIVPALNGLMGGTLKTSVGGESRKIVLADRKGYSESKDGRVLTLSASLSGFPKQTTGVGERVAVFLSGLGRRGSAHTEACANAMDWYLSFRLRELLGGRFDGSEKFRGDLSKVGSGARKLDPEMSLYDLRGESQNRKAKKLTGSEKSRFAQEKCLWVFAELRKRNDDVIGDYLKAWEREQAAGTLADPVSQDDLAALFSVAVGEDLFDWFDSHGMPSSPDRTRVKAKFTGASTPTGWMDDLELAEARAKASGKMILAAFEGSDWCGWCKKMEKDVYTQPDFMPRVTPRFVPVYVDKPRDSDLLSEKCRERNPELHGEYGIRGVPCVLILDAEGKEIGRVGGYKPNVDALMERVDAIVGRPQDPSANVCTDEKRKRKTGGKTSTPAGMTDDFSAACEQAKREKKGMLLVFSGSDWCGFCKRLDDDVLSEKKFIRQVSRKYVPVYVDSPRDRSLLSSKAQEQNPRLVDRYSPNGYPTVVVTDADGEEIVRFSGYGGGGSSAFMRRLEDSVKEVERERKRRK